MQIGRFSELYGTAFQQKSGRQRQFRNTLLGITTTILWFPNTLKNQAPTDTVLTENHTLTSVGIYMETIQRPSVLTFHGIIIHWKSDQGRRSQ